MASTTQSQGEATFSSLICTSMAATFAWADSSWAAERGADHGWRLSEWMGILSRTIGLLRRILRPLDAIGYRQVRDLLAGELAGEVVEDEIVKETMRYAKRQMTWFRHQTRVEWHADADAALAAAVAWLSGGDSDADEAALRRGSVVDTPASDW